MGNRRKGKLFAILLTAEFFALTAAGCSSGTSPADPVRFPKDQQSGILSAVRSGDAYAKLISSYTGSEENALYSSIPYSFLNSQGIDSEQYRSGNKLCFCSAYIEKGQHTLNFSLRAELPEQSDTLYYLCYTISYELNEQEYREYDMLHHGRYIEAPFFVQELAKQKHANIHNQIKIAKEEYDSVYKIIGESDVGSLLDAQETELDVLEKTETEITVAVRPACTDKTTEGKLITLTAQTDNGLPPETVSNFSMTTDESNYTVITYYPCYFNRFENTLKHC